MLLIAITKPALRLTRFIDRKSTRLNSSHLGISYDVFGDHRDLRSFPTRRSSDLCLKVRLSLTRHAQHAADCNYQTGVAPNSLHAVFPGQVATLKCTSTKPTLAAMTQLDPRAPFSANR